MHIKHLPYTCPAHTIDTFPYITRATTSSKVNFKPPRFKIFSLLVISRCFRLQKLEILCKVMGVEIIYDPDSTYELTIDNMMKILAIHMRFKFVLTIYINSLLNQLFLCLWKVFFMSSYSQKGNYLKTCGNITIL